jgi:hypothetical protein
VAEASAALDLFLDLVFSRSTNLREVSGLNGPRDFVLRPAGSGSEEIFGTLSGARTPAKPFIVGFITPDVLVNFVPVDPKKVEATTAAANPEPAGPKGPRKPPGSYEKLPDSYYAKLKEVAASIPCRPEDLIAVLVSESGMDPQNTAYLLDKSGKVDKDTPVAIGLNQITLAAIGMAGMDEDFWRNEYGKLDAEDQLPYVGRYFRRATGGRAANLTDLYMSNASAANMGNKDPDHVVFEGEAARQNAPLDKDKDGKITIGEINDFTAQAKAKAGRFIADYNAAIARGARPRQARSGSSDPASAGDPGGIMSNGPITDPEGSDPLYNLGRNIQVSTGPRLQIAQAQTDELRDQIRRAKAVPALAMLVNPSSFDRSYESVADPVKVRRGYAVHIWNERPMTVSCSGTTAAQYAFRSDGVGGLTHFNRLHSASYKNLLSLVSLYKNNGHIFRGAPNQDPSNRGTMTLAMSVYIYYDEKMYVGSFDDFSVSDNAEKPHTLSYDFKFTCRYEVDLPQFGVDDGFRSLSSRFGRASS